MAVVAMYLVAIEVVLLIEFLIAMDFHLRFLLQLQLPLHLFLLTLPEEVREDFAYIRILRDFLRGLILLIPSEKLNVLPRKQQLQHLDMPLV